MRDIRNMYPQMPVPVLGALQRNRIVKVACINGVDRNDGFSRQIQPSRQILFIEQTRLLSCLLQDIFGKCIGQTEFVNDAQRVDARLSALSQDLRQHGLTRQTMAGEPQHFNDDFVLWFRTFRPRVSDRNRIGEDGAVDAHEPAT